MTQNHDLIVALTKQAEEYKKMALYSVDICTIATAVALSDDKVKATIIEKVNNGNVFQGHRCLKYPTNFEIIYVYFDFDCPTGVFCFIKPSFAVSVNLISRKVIDIVDPFITSEIDLLLTNLETPSNNLETLSNFETSSLGIPWPKLKHIQVKVFIENNQLVAVSYYKGKEKSRVVLADLSPELCNSRGNVDLFSISISGIGISIYLRYLWICIKPDESKVDYSFQIWARSGSAKTKLSDTINGSLNW